MITLTTRAPHADLIRVTAMFMVIMLHTVLTFSLRPDFFPSKLFFITEIISALSKTSVLLFFMLSGYLVVDKNKPTKINALITLKKILIPLIFFTLINILIDYSRSRDIFSIFVSNEVQNLMTFPNSPLWFLIVLAPLYLLNPVWASVLAEEKEKNKTLVFCLLLFLYTIVATLLIQFFSSFYFSNFFAWTEFASFYLYGAIVKKNWINTSNFLLNGGIFIIGFVSILVGDWYSMSNQAAHLITPLNWYTNNYLSIPVILTSVALFNILLNLPITKEKYPHRIVTFFAQHSFGIYLLHPYIITFFTSVLYFTFDRAGLNPYLYNIVNVILVLTLSTVITYFLRKSPTLKVLIGG